MKQKATLTRSRWLFACLLSLLMTLGGTSSALADSKALPYNYGFESEGSLGEGWTLNNVANNNTNYVKVSTTSAKTGTYGYQLSSYNGGTANQLLVSPELDAPSGVVVSFAYKSSNSGSYGVETFKVGYSTTDTDPASFTWGDAINESSATWKTFEETYPAGTKYVAVNYISSNKYYLYVDDFTFETNETYKKPKNFSQVSWTSTSATLSWTAGSTEEAWQIVYSTDADFNPSLASPIDVTTNPYTLTGLVAETTYYAYIRADYGEDHFSSWSDKLTFIASAAVELTLNDDIKTSNYLPFYGYKANAASNHGQFIIPSTSLTSVIDNNITKLTFYNSTSSVNFGTVTYKVYLKEVSFTSFGTAEFVDWASMTEVYSGSLTITGNKMEIILDTPFTYGGDDLMVGFYQTATGTASAYADTWVGATASEYTGVYSYLYSSTPYYYRTQFLPKTTITYLPIISSTPKPKFLSAANITNNSVQLSWTSTATSFDLLYKADGDGDWTSIEGITANPYTLTGLNQLTPYEVKVRGDFGLDGKSDYTNAISFTTKVNPIVAYPYTENFNSLSSGEIPAYWDNSEGTTADNDFKWSYNTSYGTGHEGKCVRFDSYSNNNGNTNFLKTRPFNFTEGQPMKLSFWYKNPTGGDFSVYASTDGGTTYPTVLATALTGKSDWTQKEIDIPASVFGNNVVIVFKGTSNYGSGDARIYLDDVIISEVSAYSMSVSGGDVSENTIAFGTVKNTTTTKTFTINNDGSGDLTDVSVVSSDAEVFTVSETGFNIAAGQSKEITVTFVKAVEGDYSKKITISQADVATPIVLTATATYQTPTPATMEATLDEAAIGASVVFGTVNKATVKTFKVTNTGEATLNATIAITGTDAAKFTPSTTSLVVAGGSNETFTITFNSDDEDVAKTATVTLSAADLPNVSFDVTGTYSNFWTEDFEGGTLPTGWVITPGTYSGDTYAWHIGTFSSYENKTNMAVAPTSTTYNTIITPRLAAKEDDVLTWDAYFNWSDEYMTVEWSNDGTSGWTTIYNQYKPEDESISTQYYHKEMSFTAPADGNYYLRFTSRYSNGIDNFSGFKLNPKTHDASITAKSIPASGSQYVDYTATVTVNELLGKDDEVVTAELWIGATKVATEADVTLNASASKVISLTFTPATAMSGDAYIKVYNGDNSIDLTSDVQAVTIAEALVLDETVDPAILSIGVEPSVVVKYNAKNGWNTICMPFALTSDILTSIFGTGWKIYEFKGYNSETKELSFGAPIAYAAGYPYIVYVETAASHPEGVKLFDVNVAALEPNHDTYSGATFQGTYAPKAAGSLTDNYGVTTAGKIVKANSSASMKGFRAYFTGLPTNATARLSFYDETTGITTVMDAKELNNDGKVYNLNGQRVENAHKGLYIVNGRKVVVK